MSERVGAGAGAPDEKAPEAAPTAAGTTATAGAAAPDALALLDGLLPEQRRVVTTLDRPVFVAAGAGSGKTFTLTRRIVWALCPGSGEGGRPYLDSLDQALVITFTEKAAGEIKERVRGALRAAGLADEALKVDSAWVSTIHHMCARILRAHALDLGLDPAFGMVGDQQAQALRGRAIEAALIELKDEPALASLFEAYPASAGPLASEDVLGLVRSLLNKAATATDGLAGLDFVSAEADVSGSMGRLLNAYEALCACDSKYADELELCRGALERLRAFSELAPSRRTAAEALAVVEGLYRPNGNRWRAKAHNQFCKDAQAELDLARAELALASVQALEAPLMRLASRVDELFAADKRAAGVLDNDDLLQLLARAFHEHPDIAREYARRFRLVMVDEFQDTNAQQVDMVKALSGEGACHLTTVGDAQQAIYMFRGADVHVFEARGAEVGEQDTVRLDYNFRSDDAILRFVARVCGDTGIVPSFMDLKPKPNRKSEFPEQAAPRVVVELTRAHKLGRAGVPKDVRVALAARQLADRLARVRAAGVEPRRMAVLMRSLAQADVYIEALRERGLESVVVGGSTFSQAPEVRVVEALLHALASPQDTKSGLFPVLSSDMFSLDADDLLMLATRPQDVLDAPAKRRIWPGMREGAPFYGDAAPSERLVRARRVMGRAWSRVGRLPVADVLLMAVRESGWLARLERAGVTGRARAANVLAAVRHVRELAEAEALDVIQASDEFSRWLEAAKEGPASLSGEGLDAVSLMTAHASKGLEFDVVAVVGCTGSERVRSAPRLLSRRRGERISLSLAPRGVKLPDLGEDMPASPEECKSPLEWRCLMEAERLEDERREDGRLLYVALTRAKECVILCLSATEGKGGALLPTMAQEVCSGVFAERPVAGEGRFDYGGAAAGLVRCVDVAPVEGGAVSEDWGGTLREGPVAPAPETPAPNVSVTGTDVTGAATTGAAGTAPFELYDVDASLCEALTFWRPREGVFSYSSASRALAAGADAAAASAPVSLDDVLALPVAEPLTPAELARLGTVPTGEGPAPSRRHEKAPLAAGGDGASEQIDDADRATNLGTAFHELARYMVETGHEPRDERVATVAATYGVGRRDRVRLTAALGRWASSDLRREVLGHALVRAEVPFFCRVSSPLGDDLEGAIDLLATDGPASPASGHALLVDYKTGDHGLTLAQIRARHEMQARFYAFVLREQGFSEIDCAFVCVELEDEAGQPVVTRYRFR